MAETKKSAAADKASAPSVDDDIVEEKDGTFTFECGLNVFGKRAAGPVCGFRSNQWPDEGSARQRGEQHYKEHEEGEPMPELADFITDNKIEV